jgi:RHS repeat-associated protein
LSDPSLLGVSEPTRLWNQPTGRLETIDPYDGTTLNPLTLHKYAYVAANPVNWRDPSGKDIVEYSVFQKVIAGGLIASILAEAIARSLINTEENPAILPEQPHTPEPGGPEPGQPGGPGGLDPPYPIWPPDFEK